MEEKMERASTMLIQEEKIDCLYPMYFGVSCAFVALKILAESDVEDMQWSEARDRMLQGSASLLGLLVWRVQREEAEGRSELLHKLKKVETEVAELKRRRSEDAKANEKVVSIYAAQEQCWLGERKKLQLRIVALAKQLRIRETQEEETISTLNKMAQDKDLLINCRDKALEEVEGKRREIIEEKLHKAEATIEELKKAIKKEVEEHSSEIWKHKTAVIELVSNQRQLEAEMGRAFRQVESADSVLKQKEESVLMAKKLSVEMVKMCKDSEQKDKILSAMLRKSKLDTAEKQILLKEVKISKAKEKQAELDTDRWRAVCESRHEQHSSRRNLPNQAESRSDIYSGVKGTRPTEAGSSQNWRIGSQPNSKKVNPKTLLLEYLEAEHRNEWECIAPHRAVDATSGSSNKYLSEGNQDLAITTDVEHLEGWVRSETEKNITMLEQRYHLEIEAFAEELRHKDEKLEASRWRLLSMELESKRLQSCMQELDQNLSQFRKENMKLEALLLNREGELKSLTEFIDLHLKTHHCQKTDWNSSVKDQAKYQNAIWSEVKIIKFKPSGAGEPKHTSTQESDTEKDVQIPLSDQSQEIGVQAPEKEIEVEKEVMIDWGHVGERRLHPQDINIIDTLASDSDHLIKKDASPWKMDLHALGVSYNIKRLNQQLLLLDKLTGRPKSCDKKESDDDATLGIKKFVLLMSLLSKQVSRYHNLQEKINDLCKRMHENEIEGTTCDSKTARTNEEIKTLGSFLEETFQLQRYMVATGQKLMEIQSRIASGLVAGVKENNRSARFDMGRFSDSVKNLFKEVQRGLDVRIAKIIGNIEGTLASDGIIHVRNKCK